MPMRCTCWASWLIRQATRIAAIDLIGRAIAINPAVSEYHSNLGESYRRAGQWEEAIASLRRAIELKPDLADAHINLSIGLEGPGTARRGDRRM